MDSDWNSASFAPGTLECLLCKDIVDYIDGDRINFINHMKNIHKAKFHHNLMLAITFFDNDNLNSIVDQFERTSDALTFNAGDVEVLLEEQDEEVIELETENIKDFGKKKDAKASLDVVDVQISPIKKQVHNCELCEKRFSNRAALNKHISKNHQNIDKRKASDNDTVNASPPKVPKLEVNSSDADLSKCIEYDYIITNSEYFKKNPKQITSKCNINLHSMDVFPLIDETIPSGWRVREHTRSDGIIEKHYLAPDGRVIKSKRGAFEYIKMIKKYSATKTNVTEDESKSAQIDQEATEPIFGDLWNHLKPVENKEHSENTQENEPLSESQKSGRQNIKKSRKSLVKKPKEESVQIKKDRRSGVEAKPARRSGVGKECPECSKVVGNLKTHIEDMHSPPGHFPCSGCGKVYTSKNKQSSHYSRNCKIRN